MNTITTPEGRASVGDVLHVNVSGFMVFGNVYARGQEIRLDADKIAASLGRDGASWIDRELARPDGRVGLGPWPEGQATYDAVGDPTWHEQYARARAEAYAHPTAEERDAALREIRRIYGDGLTTSRTIGGPSNPAEQRAAQEQRLRLDAEGVRSRSSYSPQRRSV